MQIVSSVKMEVADTHYYYSLHYVGCSDVLLGKQFPPLGLDGSRSWVREKTSVCTA